MKQKDKCMWPVTEVMMGLILTAVEQDHFIEPQNQRLVEQENHWRSSSAILCSDPGQTEQIGHGQ